MRRETKLLAAGLAASLALGCAETDETTPVGFDGELEVEVTNGEREDDGVVVVKAGADGKGTVALDLSIVGADFDLPILAEVHVDSGLALETLPPKPYGVVLNRKTGDTAHRGKLGVPFDQVGDLQLRTVALDAIDIQRVVTEGPAAVTVALAWIETAAWSCYQRDAPSETVLSPRVSVMHEEGLDLKVTWSAEGPGVFEVEKTPVVDGESEGTLLIPGGLTGEAAGPITVTATVASTSIARVVSALATCE